ncbi:MAG: 2Fe-2S iron-sulfur cluster-binding protein [Pseudomonadota bacterium]
MPQITFIDLDGNEHAHEVEAGMSVMEGAIKHGVPGILAICGGSCACSTCHCYVGSDWWEQVGPPNDIEDSTLDLALERQERSRLSCQIEITDEMDGLIIQIAQNDG